MYRIVLACKGIVPNAGAQGARDICDEIKHRHWHKNVTSLWDGSQIILQAENDFDSEGLALMDEFSDALSACVGSGREIGRSGEIEVVSMTAV